MRILVIEDEAKLAATVAQGLEQQGFAADIVLNGDEAVSHLEKQTYALVLLDLMLPGLSGLDLLRWLRQRSITCPVLILTSRDGVEDRVQGLDAGADDYLVKPFALSELLRRAESRQPAQLELADLQLDLEARRAFRSGKQIELTPREFELLKYLFQHSPAVVSREMLARDIWRETSRFTPIHNVIDVQIARLRRKVDDPFDPRLLQTVRGVGFALREEKG
ncbi:MAG: response regulator transcription factor [Sulfobacillus sp.]